jgi:hypothetical protein
MDDEEIILDDWNPSEATIRRWAYDDTILLASQDEDLVLGGKGYFPVLIPLASDPYCPKATYILSIMDFYTMFETLWRDTPTAIDVLESALNLAKPSSDEKITAWAALLERRILYKKGIGAVDKTLALQMGQDLLNGISRKCDISIIKESSETWTVRLSVPPYHLHQEFLNIDKRTGLFQFTR